MSVFLVQTCSVYYFLISFQPVDKIKCDVNLGFLHETAAPLYPRQHVMSSVLFTFYTLSGDFSL